MTNREYQEWLKQFPDDVLIECVYHSRGSGYYDQGGNAYVVDFSPTQDEFGYSVPGHFEYCDRAKTLRIGGHNE